MARISNRIEHSRYEWAEFSGQHGKLTVTAYSGYEFNPDYTYRVEYYTSNGSGPFYDNLTISSDKKYAEWKPSRDISENKLTTVTGILVETKPAEPTVTNNVSGATETHTYENGVLNITIKADTSGYILKDIIATIGATNTPFVLDDTETTGTLQLNASATDTVVISGSTILKPVEPTVTNNVSGATETHTYENGVLNITINANTSGYILKDIIATVGATNTPFVLDDTETTGTLQLNVSATDTVVISGSTVKTLPVVQKLANCTSNNKPYYPVGGRVYFTVTADNGKVFNETPTVEYLTVGQTERVYLTVSENKKTAVADFVLDVSAQVQIILTANAVQETPIAKKYGSINVYLTNETELAQFANFRFKQITSEYYITKDYGQFVNRIKRIFTRIPYGDTDVMFFGNYNSQIDTHVPENLLVTLNFGSVTIPTPNNDTVDYESDIILFIPFVGNVNIPTDYIGQDINLQIDIDVVTGNGLYKVLYNDTLILSGECNPSIDVLYETVDMKKVGGDNWNEQLYMGLEPYLFVKWYESKNPDGRNNDFKKGKISSFTGFNSFDNVVIQPTANMLAREQEMILTTLLKGVYVE